MPHRSLVDGEDVGLDAGLWSSCLVLGLAGDREKLPRLGMEDPREGQDGLTLETLRPRPQNPDFQTKGGPTEPQPPAETQLHCSRVGPEAMLPRGQKRGGDGRPEASSCAVDLQSRY